MNDSSEIKVSFYNKMVTKLKGSIPEILGTIIGGVGGYIYYYKVGCTSGTCPITSNPWLSILWGAAMGYLLVGIFSSKQK